MVVSCLLVALVMVWHRTNDKPLTEPIVIPFSDNDAYI